MYSVKENHPDRNYFIDYLKGLAIFLVVWGHAIQYAPHHHFDFFQNPVFIFIYSFHMPLFMFISGYLFLFSSNKNTKTILHQKFLQLIIPILFWSLLYDFAVFIIRLKSSQDANILTQMITFFISYMKALPYEFWFLWAVFYCSIATVICKLFFKDKAYSYIILFAILLLIPDFFNTQYIKFMYPYFIAGYLYNKDKNKYQSYLKYIKLFSFIVFPAMLVFWNKDFYIYITGMSIYGENPAYMLFIIIFRYLIGFVGIVFVMQLIKKSMNYFSLNLITHTGKYTLGIYIISQYINKGLHKIPINIDNNIIYNFIFTPALSIFIIYICLLLIKLLQRNQYTNKLFLGGR